MPAPITNHEIVWDPRDDLDHPIPRLGVIDVAGYKSGGANLSIVVASPLQDDERSQTRLLDKIQGYLSHMASDQYAQDAGGPPSPETAVITVALHPQSAPGIFQLLGRCHDWVRSANARLEVRHLSQHEIDGT